jgi:glycosyltransferase involved in cell wall biosynthesis
VRRNPRVSVLMSVYDGERYLRQAIESVLHQVWTDFEFLIVNDGSTDNSRQIIASFDDPRICLIDNPVNVGLTKSLNRGLLLARGELVARQDADDLSHPARLEQQVRFLDSHPGVALLGTQIRITNGKGRVLPSAGSWLPMSDTAVKWSLMFQNAFAHSAVMYRHDVVWDQMRGYDEGFVRSQDYDLWSRIAEKHAVRNLAEALVDCRRHPDSIMARNEIQNVWLPRVISANLKRFLELSEVPKHWAPLVFQRFAGKIDDPESLVAVEEKIFARFCDLHPCAKVDREIRRLRARTMARIGYLSAPYRRLASIRAYAHACRLDPGVLRGGALPKYIVCLLGGGPIRRRLRGM